MKMKKKQRRPKSKRRDGEGYTTQDCVLLLSPLSVVSVFFNVLNIRCVQQKTPLLLLREEKLSL